MTDFENDLKQKFNKKGLAQSSINVYIRNLQILNDNKPFKSFKFLKNVETINDKLTNKSNNTKRAYYIAIVSSLDFFKDIKALDNLRKKYYTHMINISKQIDKDTEDNKMNNKEKKNWMSWEEIVKKCEDLGNLVEQFKTDKSITQCQYNTLLNYVILSLYVYQAPRRNEYANMLLVYQVLSTFDDNINYLSWFDKTFHFNNYKTVKSHGKQLIAISDKMMDIINIYIKFHPLLNGKIDKKKAVHFLVYDNGDLVSSNAITRLLNNIFEKKVSSSMIRHIYITSKFGKIYEEEQKVAENMAHSETTQKKYIRKKNKVEEES